MTTQANKSHDRNRLVVIVGVDFSEASAHALSAAANLASRAAGGELHLVHVVSAVIPPATGVAPEPGHNVDIQECRQKLRSLFEPLYGRGLRLLGHVRVGNPDREIAQVASDLGADLIVVGTQGKHGLERLLLGSVAESLVRHAPCPVLVQRPRVVPVWETIEPPCADCVAVQQATNRASLWCKRHSEHHASAHTYHEVPDSYGVGSQTFRT